MKLDIPLTAFTPFMKPPVPISKKLPIKSFSQKLKTNINYLINLSYMLVILTGTKIFPLWLKVV